MRGDLEGEWIHGYVWLNPSAFCSPEAITALLISYESVSHSVSQLCYPMGLPDSVHGILQARILEWVAISYSRGSSQPRYQTWVSCITGRFFTIWATICQYKIKRFFFFFLSLPSSFGLFGNLLWAGPDSIHCPALHFCGPLCGFFVLVFSSWVVFSFHLSATWRMWALPEAS